MMQMARSLHPVRATLSKLTSPPSLLPASRNSLKWKSLPLTTLAKHFEPAIFNHGSSYRWKLFAQRHRIPNLSKSGSYFSMRRICGLSITFGSIYLCPKIASAMDEDGYDDRLNYMSASEAEEKYRDILALMKKLLLPIFLTLTIVTNWGSPIILVTKVILTLITTKPSPYSVYVSIEELRNQLLNQRHPFLSKFKSMYAKKVEIDDYTLLCIARVELNDEKLTLIGLLGSWWILPCLPCLQIEEAFVAVKNRLSGIYNDNRYLKYSKLQI
ncbi:uncharacterized protein LOC124927192 isoform X2 [Impatiens glandulifera]|uniref:uncharacterized protein LOC124927192 isoform X2 n=1 Tax=Impatiens glandulifera TaxID=253017 RepID=UPI001FB12DE6|nr:uncharacterized protein LOC124927192 isoform X2 [Impatiens glandulifera]